MRNVYCIEFQIYMNITHTLLYSTHLKWMYISNEIHGYDIKIYTIYMYYIFMCIFVVINHVYMCVNIMSSGLSL